MKQKFGIRKTKMNIFWLFVVGLIIGGVLGLRQPTRATTINQPDIIQEAQK